MCRAIVSLVSSTFDACSTPTRAERSTRVQASATASRYVVHAAAAKKSVGQRRGHHHRPAQPADQAGAPLVDVLRFRHQLGVRGLAGEERHQERCGKEERDLHPSFDAF